MIEVNPAISMRKQCELLSACRSSVYYTPVATDPEQLALSISAGHLLTFGVEVETQRPRPIQHSSAKQES